MLALQRLVDTLVPNSLLLMVIAKDFPPVDKGVNLGVDEISLHNKWYIYHLRI